MARTVANSFTVPWQAAEFFDLVRQAIYGLDGEIRIESQLNKGSIFFVTLPKRRYTHD